LKTKTDTQYFANIFDGDEAAKQMKMKALEIANNVLVIVGSANSPRSYRNPFTSEERIEIISQHFQRLITTCLVIHLNFFFISVHIENNSLYFDINTPL
jgi:nicotinamide mononucleotide adenylyltransferase